MTGRSALSRTSETTHLPGTHSAGEIKSKCAAAGGAYQSGPYGYSCYAAGIVACNSKGKCSGDCDKCPKIRPAPSAGGARPPGSAGNVDKPMPAVDRRPLKNFAGGAASHLR
jgi:hypothetical protein